jgi:hypothetical protein
MADPAGEALRLHFDRRLMVQFRGSALTSDAGLLAYREVDDALGLTTISADTLADARPGKNGRFETEWLTQPKNLAAWRFGAVRPAARRRSPRRWLAWGAGAGDRPLTRHCETALFSRRCGLCCPSGALSWFVLPPFAVRWRHITRSLIPGFGVRVPSPRSACSCWDPGSKSGAQTKARIDQNKGTEDEDSFCYLSYAGASAALS